MKLVIDASVALKWILGPLGEPNAQEAGELLSPLRRGDVELFAPAHWFAEVVAVVTRQQPDRLEDTLDLLNALKVEIVNGRNLLTRAAKLSRILDHHLFDTLYHAVAIEQMATLITADERYFAKAKELGMIKLLGQEKI